MGLQKQNVMEALESEEVDEAQEDMKHQSKRALADGFAQSTAFFGKQTYALEGAEQAIRPPAIAEDKKKKTTKLKKKKTVKALTTEQETSLIRGKEKSGGIGATKKSEKDAVETENERTHEDLKARRTVFVGNVSLEATPKDVKRHFSVCGRVASVRLRHLPIAGCAVDEAGNQKLMMKVCASKKILTTAKDNCNAYVTFADEKSVDAALKLNGTTLAHKKIRVDHSEPVIDARRSVFLGNVPFKCTDEQMQQFFSKRLKSDEEPEPIENVRLIRDRESGLGKGFGYLLLKTPALVAKTLTLRDLKMETRELRVQVCGKRFKNLRGEETAKEKFEGLRASAGARARIHLKRRVGIDDGDRRVATKRLKREATAAGLGKKLKPKHAARKAAKAATASSGNVSKKRRAEATGSHKGQKRPQNKPKHATRKASKA